MEVILLNNVKNLGKKDDVLKVKNGYGRNFLIPQKLAIIATETNRKILQENLKQQSLKRDKIKKEFESLAEKLRATIIKVGAKVGKEGKIFGSVNSIQISEAIKKTHGIDVDRKQIEIERDIKQIGTYKATLDLHKEVPIEVKFEVVEE